MVKKIGCPFPLVSIIPTNFSQYCLLHLQATHAHAWEKSVKNYKTHCIYIVAPSPFCLAIKRNKFSQEQKKGKIYGKNRRKHDRSRQKVEVEAPTAKVQKGESVEKLKFALNIRRENEENAADVGRHFHKIKHKIQQIEHGGIPQ